jgi:tripartite-type tricarboxylate transporter receptor subunit TctC
MTGEHTARWHDAGRNRTRVTARRMGALAPVTVFLMLARPFDGAAAEYPERQLTAVVPFAAGASNDAIARRITPHLAKALGQQIIVENRPGADGRIGIEAVAKAAPDGYTLLFSAGAVVLIPALRKHVSWDPVRHIQPVAELGTIPYVFGVNTNVPAQSVSAFIKLATAHPGKLNGSAGGNSSEMTIALFRIKTGTRLEIIPYKGTGQAVLAVATGEADFGIMDASAWLPLIASKRVRALAVVGPKRISIMPDVPTTQEAGLPDFTAGAQFGVFTTGGAPMTAVRRLNAEINRIVAMPEVTKGFLAIGLAPANTTVEGYTRQYLADLAMWKDVVARARIPMTD